MKSEICESNGEYIFKIKVTYRLFPVKTLFQVFFSNEKLKFPWNIDTLLYVILLIFWGESDGTYGHSFCIHWILTIMIIFHIFTCNFFVILNFFINIIYTFCVFWSSLCIKDHNHLLFSPKSAICLLPFYSHFCYMKQFNVTSIKEIFSTLDFSIGFLHLHLRLCCFYDIESSSVTH